MYKKMKKNHYTHNLHNGIRGNSTVEFTITYDLGSTIYI